MRYGISAGPRVSFASSDYFDAYYGVNADEAAASGLAEYDPAVGSSPPALAARSTGR
jgi:outer membrane scaffolding protein for murein synthesis (MipA/OmpV family)